MAQPGTFYGSNDIRSVFKTLFEGDIPEQLSKKDKDFLRWVPTADDLDSEGIFVHMRTGMPQGLSSDFKGMQASHTSSKNQRVFITRSVYYGGISIDAESIHASRNKMAAYFKVKEEELSDVISNVSEELEKSLWRNGSGVIGTIASITTGGPSVITFTNPDDVANFAVNQYLECRTANLVTDRGGDEKIFSVSYSNGTVTMTTDVATDHGWAVGDVLIRGANGAIASDVNKQITGLDAWFPEAYETSGLFLGMDRTRQPELLQGFRGKWQGTIEETIKNATSLSSRYGAKHDSAWTSHDNWKRLEIELSSRAIRKEASDETFGIPVLMYSYPKGVIEIYPGAYCPQNVMYVTKRDSFKLHHLLGLPHIVDDDGLSSLRGADFDGIAIRIRYWAGLSCNNPKNTVRLEIK